MWRRARKTAAQVFKLVDTYQIDAVPYDMPVVGYNNDCVNTLRTWSARSRANLDLTHFGRGRIPQGHGGNADGRGDLQGALSRG